MRRALGYTLQPNKALTNIFYGLKKGVRLARYVLHHQNRL